MTTAQILIAVGALTGALLASEVMLAALRLHRLRVGTFPWLAGVVALAYGAQWAPTNSNLSPAQAHYAAVGLAAVLTCLWFNDHRSRPPQRLAARSRAYSAARAEHARHK